MRGAGAAPPAQEDDVDRIAMIIDVLPASGSAQWRFSRARRLPMTPVHPDPDCSGRFMHPTVTRYEIELDVLERRPDLCDREAIALLRSEFVLALNASHFIALSAQDPVIDVQLRVVPQEGVARYALTLDVVERDAGASEEQAIALVRSEFQRALNASHFWRVCVDDPTVTIVSRAVVGSRSSWLRRAA
jgi:hypothetical protein